MATFGRVVAALSCVVLSMGARTQTHGLAHLATEVGLPCELKVTYGKAKDDGELVDSITFFAECTESVRDCWLDQPYQDDKHPGEVVSIKMDGKGADKDLMEKGTNKLRTLRLVDELFGYTYVGKTFTLRAKNADGVEGQASITILEPSEAKALEAAKLADSSPLPCTLSAVSVPLQNNAAGFKITLNCDEEVEGVKLTAPKPYGSKSFKSLKPGGTYKLLIVDSSKLQGADFLVTGKTIGGDEELSASVTVTLPDKEAATQEEDRVEAKKTEVPAKADVKEPSKADVKEPSKAGESPCAITKETFEDSESKEAAFSLTLKCSEAITSGELKWGPTQGEVDQTMTFGDHTFEKGAETQILSTMVGPLEGKIIWFEGKKADGTVIQSNAETV